MSNNGTFATQRSSPVRTERSALRARDLVITPPTLSNSVNDYCPAGIDTCEVIRLSSSTSVNITGIKAIADGRPRLLWNVGSSAIVLMNGSSSSVVGNRFATVSDVTLVSNSTSVIQYDLASKVWRVIGQELAGTGTSGQVLTSNGAGTLPTFQAGGITGFTSSQNTSSPNNVRNASQLLVSAASTNADAVLAPKGTGSVLASLPDGTTTGGNKRGIRCVDLQTKFTAATQVASGDYSVAIGIKNTASGTSSVAIGQLVAATGAVASGLGGYRNDPSGDYSTVIGGKDGTTRGLFGAVTMACGKFGTQGDAQRGQYILRCLTTNATQTTLTADQGAASTTNQVILPNNSGYTIRGMAHAHRTDSVGTSVSWAFMANIRRGANAASTTLVGSSITEVAKDSGGLTWLLDLSADTTNGGLAIKFTGEASKTIRTVCVVESCEVTS